MAKRKTRLQEIQAAEDKRAAEEAAIQAAEAAELNERRGRNLRLLGAWPRVNDFTWPGWLAAISNFCEQVRKEGQTGTLAENVRQLLDLDARVKLGFIESDREMFSLLLAGFEHGISAIESCLAELAEAGHKGWVANFKGSNFLDLIQNPDIEDREKWARADAERKANQEADTTANESELRISGGGDIGDKIKRTIYKRPGDTHDRKWLDYLLDNYRDGKSSITEIARKFIGDSIKGGAMIDKEVVRLKQVYARATREPKCG